MKSLVPMKVGALTAPPRFVSKTHDVIKHPPSLQTKNRSRDIKAHAHHGLATDIIHLAALELNTGNTTGLDLDLAHLALPTALISTLGIFAIKFIAYSQLEVVRTSMLSRHVTPNGAKVLQLGGTTRDLFYYPKKTIQVIAAGNDITPSLWEQAGIQAQIPVRAIKADTKQCIQSQAGSCVDSVVLFNQLNTLNDSKQMIQEAWRVLKPGGTFIFIQQIPGSAVSSLVRLGGSTSDTRIDIGDMVATSQAWDFCQWDVAADGLDPHAVGVAIKPLNASSSSQQEFSSVDSQAFEQVMKTATKKKKQGDVDTKKKGFSSS